MGDGIFADNTYQFPFSAWEQFIPMIEEGNPCSITNLQVCIFQGRPCLATTSDSVSTEGQPIEVDVQEVVKNFTKQTTQMIPSALTICCQKILGVKISFYPICTNRKCHGEKVVLMPRHLSVECSGCGRSMLVRKCQCVLTGDINFEKDERI